jgi:hypothetical protein
MPRTTDFHFSDPDFEARYLASNDEVRAVGARLARRGVSETKLLQAAVAVYAARHIQPLTDKMRTLKLAECTKKTIRLRSCGW